MVLIGNSREDLQHSLNRLHEYCERWGLEVNIDKTKIVVFRKRGKIKATDKWYFNNSEKEVVDNFNYLGVILNYTGSFNLNNQYLVGKALKAMHILGNNVLKYQVNSKLSLQLFDVFVGSILNYGCQTWGFTKAKDLEKVRLKFCKLVLGVKQSTCTAAVYGELGRYPLYINRHVMLVKYWFKLLNSGNILLSTIYDVMTKDLIDGKTNWLTKIKSLLQENEFLYVWEHPNAINQEQFIVSFKQRLINSYIQTWFTNIPSSTVLSTFYNFLKEDFTIESYLKISLPRDLKISYQKYVHLHIIYLLNLGGMVGLDYPEMKEYVVIVI